MGTLFNAANYLNTVDDVAAYLEAAIDESADEPTVITQALGTITQNRRSL